LVLWGSGKGTFTSAGWGGGDTADYRLNARTEPSRVVKLSDIGDRRAGGEDSPETEFIVKQVGRGHMQEGKTPADGIESGAGWGNPQHAGMVRGTVTKIDWPQKENRSRPGDEKRTSEKMLGDFCAFRRMKGPKGEAA